MRTVLVITNSYPQNGSPEKGFMLEELRALIGTGVSVILAPVRAVTDIDPDLPSGVTYTNWYSRTFSFTGLINAALRLPFRADFWREITNRRQPLLHPRFWKESIRLSGAERALRKIPCAPDLFYTFWFTADTIALAKTGARPLITRAHRYDLYEEHDVNRGYIAYRDTASLSKIDGIVTLSREGYEYVTSKYGVDPNRVIELPLGSPDQEEVNAGCPEGQVVFASCAFASPRKRLDLIGEVVAKFSHSHPNLNVIWHHLGADLANLGLPPGLPQNLRVKAWGVVSREQTFDFYKSTGVSLFINLSLSEGQPVSIMEAMSFGVPIVATDVGGVLQMFETGGGIVVNVDAGSQEIATTISCLMNEPDWRSRLGAEAQFIQREKFSATRNGNRFALFANEIMEHTTGVLPVSREDF